MEAVNIYAQEPGSPHRSFLRSTPLYKFDPSLLNQRRIILYGVRSRTTPEEDIEIELKSELQELLPEVFKGTVFLSYLARIKRPLKDNIR